MMHRASWLTAITMAAALTSGCAHAPEESSSSSAGDIDVGVWDPLDPNGQDGDYGADVGPLLVADGSFSGELAFVSDIDIANAEISAYGFDGSAEYMLFGAGDGWEAMMLILDMEGALAKLPIGERVDLSQTGLYVNGCSGPGNVDELPGETVVVHAADETMVGNTAMISYQLEFGFHWLGEPQAVDVNMVVSR